MPLAGPRHVTFSDGGFRSSDWPQMLSRHLALTPWPLGEPLEAHASVIWVQVGEEGAEVRAPCHGEKEVE